MSGKEKLGKNNGRVRCLWEDECQMLIESCDDHLRPIVIPGLNTGLRRSEILNLRWGNVDLEHRLLQLDQINRNIRM